MRSLLPLVALLAACSPSAGDEVLPRIEVGSPLVDGSRIRPGEDTLAVLTGSGERPENAQILLLRTAVDSTRITRVERIMGEPAPLDSFVVARVGLRPLYAAPRDAEGKRSTVTFEPAAVVREAEGRRQRQPLERPAFYANSLDMLLRALPLREGMQGSLVMYEPERARTVRANVRVLGLERVITADDGSCSGWRLQVDGPDRYRGTFWIGERSGTLVRMEVGGDLIFLKVTGCPGDGR